MSSLGRLVAFSAMAKARFLRIGQKAQWAAASTVATALLEVAGPIMTHNGRWFMTGGGTLVAAFYFGATAPAGPEDETTPLAAGADWANGKLDADNFR
jgi:hypothetical protein